MNVSVSAVIVSYFTGPLLARAVASLKNQPEIGEIIIVDNGNWDGVVEGAADIEAGAQTDAAPVEIITGHGNVGFAVGCNLGAKRASGEFLLFFNPDAIMPSGGVAQLLADGALLDAPWMMGAKLVGPNGEEQQGSRRATLTPWRAFVETTGLYYFAPKHPYFRRFNLHGEPCPSKVAPVPTISGACIFMPHKEYCSIGGMDEGYFLHVEDIDLCLRFVEAGGTVYFNPHVDVTHYKSSSRVDPLNIEARKTTSMLRYFRVHFKEPYPAPFLWLVSLAVWASLGLRIVKRATGGGLAFLGFRARAGRAGVARAKAIAARRSSR